MAPDGPAAAAANSRPGQGRAVALVRALRPRQWIKNGLVVLPFVFAVNVVWRPDDLAPVPGLLLRLGALALAFCALSSSAYLFNDLMDREADRQHPAKRLRPIASGQVGAATALLEMAVLGVAGLAALAALSWMLGAIGVLYLVINVAYSAGAKHLVLVDILSVASGYVIRIAAGAVAIGVNPSPWLYATTGAGALFIVLGRRYAEVRLAGDDAARQRSVLRHYAGPFIGQLLNISAAAALVSYTLYTVEAVNLPRNNTMLLTVPLVIFGLFRYLYLLNTSQEAEAPEHLIVKDLPLAAASLAWIAVSVLVLLLNR